MSCYDPGTLDFLGYMPAMTRDEVVDCIDRAREAQQEWRKSSFEQARRICELLRGPLARPSSTAPHFPVPCDAAPRAASDLAQVHRGQPGHHLSRRSPRLGQAAGGCRIRGGHRHLREDPVRPALELRLLRSLLTYATRCRWLVTEGEKYLRPESRSAGAMMFYKKARVEYHPYGVIGAIVPWNYPFHNVFNPLTAALFAGNAIVIKASGLQMFGTSKGPAVDRLRALPCDSCRCPSTPPGPPSITAGSSARAYGRRGPPRTLSRSSPGKSMHQGGMEACFVSHRFMADWCRFGEAGNALVTGGVDKVIFVGSTGIGRKVMEAAAENLTPVVLELGGKDAFIVCDDADLNQVVPTALRGAYQSCGQNCAGAERFIVHAKVYDAFVSKVVAVAQKLRQGPATGHGTVDCGAMCMPGLAEKVHGLVEDAVEQGARLLVGGELPSQKKARARRLPCDLRGSTRTSAAERWVYLLLQGQFYPPTVLADVTTDMEIMHEEIFGPVLCIAKFETDEDAIEIANNCPFGLGSSVFSRNQDRANRIAARLEAGMSSINDFATTYMCQSLPFGGVKESGFDRFAGIEGLRGMCVPKAVCEDRFPWLMRTDIPPPLQYPVSDVAFTFVTSIVKMFYGYNLRVKVDGLVGLAMCFLAPSSVAKKQPAKTKGRAKRA